MHDRSTKQALALLAVAGVLAAFAVGYLVRHQFLPRYHTLLGGFLVRMDAEERAGLEFVRSRGESANGTTCSGAEISHGYSDLRDGAPVTVRDAHGDIIATGALDSGRWLEDTGCFFRIEVLRVPETAFYSIEVSHRGAITKRLNELQDKEWMLQLSVGP